jgi:hypothetical protein
MVERFHDFATSWSATLQQPCGAGRLDKFAIERVPTEDRPHGNPAVR